MINNYKNLLIALLKDDVVVSSWGISAIEMKKNKISFSVRGFKYQGRVNIYIPVELNKYKVKFDEEYIGTFSSDEIVTKLDEKIEFSESDYKSLFQNIRGGIEEGD